MVGWLGGMSASTRTNKTFVTTTLSLNNKYSVNNLILEIRRLLKVIAAYS